MERFIECVILDIDQTLYKNQHLAKAYADAMINLVALEKNIPLIEARSLMDETKSTMSERGDILSTTRVMLELGITLDQWIKYSCSQVDPEKYLEKNDEVCRVTDWICNNFKVGILSNNNRIQLQRTLSAIGVFDILKTVPQLTVSETKKLKPDTSLYYQILNILNVSPKNSIAVGDRDSVDLAPAREISMCTYLVQRLEDYFALVQYLEKYSI